MFKRPNEVVIPAYCLWPNGQLALGSNADAEVHGPETEIDKALGNYTCGNPCYRSLYP